MDNQEQAESRVVYDWRIEPLRLSPGDVILYALSATDDFIAPDGTRQLGRSESMRLKIISDVEFDARLRADVALVEERLRQVVLDQAEIHDRTAALTESERGDSLSEADRERVMGLASSQERLVRTTRDLAGRVRQLVDRLLRWLT